MQTIALARALAKQNAKPVSVGQPAALKEARAPRTMPCALLSAIARQSRTQARTMVEMARDREAVLRPWCFR
jgi:hypothetical protein